MIRTTSQAPSASSDGVPYTRESQLDDGPVLFSLSISALQYEEGHYSGCVQTNQYNRCWESDLSLERQVQPKKWDLEINSSIPVLSIAASWLLCKRM